MLRDIMSSCEPLAIVGMACKLPGADDLGSFWKLIIEQGTAWGSLPESRLNRELYFEPGRARIGKSYSEIGAIISDRPVDRESCPITSEMTNRFDISHQYFLEVASKACRDAGMDPFAMPSEQKTGVYVGHTGGSTRVGDIVYSTGINEAASLLSETQAARTLLGDEVEVVAKEVTDAVREKYPGRRPGEAVDLSALGAAKIVHEALALNGPFLVIDAACASSLQALAIGARALARGTIDQAIIGGASYCKADSLVLFSAAQSVSNTGSCPFSDEADGLVTGEGYVALVIKTLARAIADGNKVRAVIRGIGVASDGKGKSLWAPRKEGQVLALKRAYPNPDNIGKIDYIEAHATSTQVGDATELSALASFVETHLKEGRQIPIGSVKANIGHTLETAGLASLVKVVLALEQSVIPPGTTGSNLNNDFDWDGGPFYVPREPTPWPSHADGSARQAAVNAFGIGGLNVHLAVSEYIQSDTQQQVKRSESEDDHIAIVGAGCVLPGAHNLEAFFERLEKDVSAIGPVPPDRWKASLAIDRNGPRTWHTMSDRGGFVRDFAYDWRRHKVPPKQIATANPLQFMLLEAADAAITEAVRTGSDLNRLRTGVVVGTLFGGEFANQLQLGLRLPETSRELRAVLRRRNISEAAIKTIVESYGQTMLKRMPALIDETGSFTSSTLASRLTKTFDLMGGALALDAGDCSSISALSAAMDMLVQQDCDAVICACGQRSLDLVTFEGLSLNGHLEKNADTNVPGEGAVVFVLKRLKDAHANGNRIRGIIRRSEVHSSGRIPPSAPSLSPLIGHTGAVAAAAELLALTKARSEGTITITDGPLIGRLEVGELAQKQSKTVQSSASISTSERPLVAALFPGQGSQYTNMFRELVTTSEEARLTLERLDDIAERLGYETLAEVAWRPDNRLGINIWDTQWAMYLGDLFAWEVLRNLGFTADIVASHSFGEFPALTATAAWTIEDGAKATKARAIAVERYGPTDGAMLSVIADRATVEAMIEPFRGKIWVCAENSPDQVVIGGITQIIDTVEIRLEKQRLKSKRLAVPSPFHTPLLARSADQLNKTITNLPIKVPGRPIISSTILERLVEPSSVRESLIRQMTDTVRWMDIIEQLYASGVRTFVEVGPSGVLTGLTRRILKGREDCTFLQFDQRHHQGSDYLKQLTEKLEAAGAIKAKKAKTLLHSPIPKPTENPLETTQGPVVFFDATSKRRERNRSETFSNPYQTKTAPLSSNAEIHPSNDAKNICSNSPDDFKSPSHEFNHATSYHKVTSPDQDKLTTVSSANKIGSTNATNSRASLALDQQSLPESAEVEALLKNFVIEQTGYPREIVDLDSDLEADLGIDSIRKAQLLGQIGQSYALKAEDNASLDEFPTLRHLLNFILERVETGSREMSRVLSTQAATANTETNHDRRTKNNSTTKYPSSVELPKRDLREEIEDFLISFVVEQTGYPREIVNLYADLEAELGIDSIRRAQLLGEIVQTYNLKPDDSISLEKFSTLKNLLDYIIPLLNANQGFSSTDDVLSIKGTTAEKHPDIRTSRATPQAAVLKDFEAMVVIPPDLESPLGLIACFGRYTQPHVQRLENAGLKITLIGIKDIPGALMGWNDSGLLVLAGEASKQEELDTMALVETIAMSCHSIEDANRLIRSQSIRHKIITVAHVDQGPMQVLPHKKTRSPLHRVVLADGAFAPDQALRSLLNRQNKAAREALSVTGAWMACGVVDSIATAVSGSPFFGSWLGEDPCITGKPWTLGPTRSSPVQAYPEAPPEERSTGHGLVTRRYSLVIQDIGPARPVINLSGERVMILAGGDLALALARIVETMGGIAIPASWDTAEEACSAVESEEERGPVRHLIVAVVAQSEAGCSTQLDASIVKAFLACQRWFLKRSKAGDIATATLTGVVDLGGDFGLAGTARQGIGGAVSGLFKAIARECPSLQVRVVDAPISDNPTQLAAAILDEIRDPQRPIEIGLLNGRRVTVVPCEQRTPNGPPLQSLNRGSVWIATGGARGVTAECARALGSRHGLVFALIGSTTPISVDPSWLDLNEEGIKELKGKVMRTAKDQGRDPRLAWRRVEKSIEIEQSLSNFRSDGVDAQYYVCDLNHEAAVRILVEQIRRQQGPVRGVLHGAGYESACLFERKTLNGLITTVGPKCLGIEHLLAALDPTTLEAIVGFGSTSGRLGGHGQTDYSLANDWLAKILGAHRQTGCRTTVIHWHAWDTVGMATRPESRFVLEQFGLTLMPLAEGVGRFLDEIEAGLPEAEVLITEPWCVPEAQPRASLGKQGSLVERVNVNSTSTAVTFRLDPTVDRFLLDHLQFGRPLLPGVMGAELLAQAVIAAGACSVVHEIRDFVIERPFAFPSNQPRQVRVQVDPEEGGTFKAVGWASAATTEEEPVAQEIIVLRGLVSTTVPEPIHEKKSEPPFPYNPMVYAEDAALWHGASFRTLTGLFLDRSGGWGRLVAPAGEIVAAPRSAEGWTMPVALLDGCLVACGVYSYILCGLRVEVPVKIDCLRITGTPRTGETCTARLHFRSSDVHESIYDLVLFGDDDRAILALNGLHLAVIGAEGGRL